MNQNQLNFIPEGYQLPKDSPPLVCFASVIDEHFFDTMGMAMVSGRSFRASDNANAPKVVIVNEVLANKYWPGKDPIGKRIRLDSDHGPWAEVIGVSKTAKYLWIAEAPLDYIYQPYAQTTPRRMTLIAQSAGGSNSVAEPLREVVRSFDPNLPIYDVRTIEEFFDMRVLGTTNTILNTIGAMGVSGLLLSMVGLYGLVAYSVSRRTREFGIRMAIGASTMNVSRMVLGQGMRLALFGVAIGIGMAVLAVRAVSSVFYSAGSDWIAFVVAPSLLLGMTALAAYVPARRASRIDPMTALRYE
jgi:putative ABC transport system permease protein